MKLTRQHFLPAVGKNVWILSLGWFASAMGFAASLPFISIYFGKEYGLSIGEIGLFFGGMAVIRSIVQAFAGEISDRIQRRGILTSTQYLRAISFLSLAAAVHWHIGFWLTALLLLVNFILGAIFQPVANAMVSDFLTSEKRLEGYALTRAAGNLGWAAGPAFGGFLAATSYDLLFIVSAFLTLASALVFSIFLGRPTQATAQDRFHPRDLLAIKDDPPLAWHCFLTLALYLVVAQLIVPFSVYAVQMTGLPEYQLGYIYTINGLIVALIQIPITRLMSRFPLTTQLSLGAFCYAIGYAWLGWGSGFTHFALAILIVTLGENLISPPGLTLTSRMAKEGRMGRYMGLHGFFLTAGWSFGPLYGGTILQWYGHDPRIAWGMIASLALVAVVGYPALSRRLDPSLNRNRVT